VQVTPVPAAVALPHFRTVVIRGELTAATVNELTIGFAPPPAVPPSSLPASSVACPVTSRKFACEVPSGLLDLTFRAPGWVALYRWKEQLDADLNVGTLTLRRGSSFTGTATFAERQPKNAPPITVTVWRDSPAAQNDDQKQRLAIARQTAKANGRGFFQFALAPGDYLIEATAEGGLRSERRSVRVLESRESQLRTPLVLERPHALTVHVDPPIAPYGKPWLLYVSLQDRAGVTESEVRAEVPRNGEWRREGFFSGHYTLMIGRSGEDSWYSAALDLAGADVIHEAKIPITHISGNVTMGGKPLEANVWFSDEKGMKAGIRTHADGTYGPILMPDVPNDTWPDVTIDNELPYVRRTFKNVKLKRRDDENRDLDLELKGATIFGDVVDEKGAIQSNAMITATTADQKVVQVESASGTFVFNAVTPGPFSLRADTREAATAGATIVNVTGEESSEVHLVVKPVSMLRGIVRSLAGPIGGAAIGAVSLENWADYVSQMPTDEEGRFIMAFSPETLSAVVSLNAPGYAYRLLRLPMRSDPVPVIVEPTGGALVFTQSPPREDGTKAYVIHAGALLPLRIIGWLSGADVDSAGRIAIGLAEEGVYSLCDLARAEVRAAADGWRPAERCATGLLPRGGTLTLEVPARAARAQ
ncbi:MAG: hypothetical protein JWO97_853, partial [Acidobacteria bacterium]|nr:hypothetical protein [Acidobacteriota bacterium]